MNRGTSYIIGAVDKEDNTNYPKLININHCGANKEAIRTYNKRTFSTSKSTSVSTWTIGRSRPQADEMTNTKHGWI